MKVRDKGLRVDVDVRVKECPTYACYWPRQNPGVFVQGRGYSNPTQDYICGTREIRGCPETIDINEWQRRRNAKDTTHDK